MYTRRFTGQAAAMVVVLASLGVAALAQDAPPAPPTTVQVAPAPPEPNGPPPAQAVSPAKAHFAELVAAANTMAIRYNAKIVVDPAISVATAVTAPDAGLPVERAMDQLVAGIRNTGWRRVYLRGQGLATPDPAKLAAAVRALSDIEQAGLVVENPLTRRATYYMKDYQVAQGFVEGLGAQQFNTTPVYVLYSTAVLAGPLAAGANTPEDQLADLQRKQVELMMKMTPEQSAQAMQKNMQMFMGLDPQTRARIMGNQIQAGMQMWQSMSPDMRQELMGNLRQLIGGMMGPGGGPRRLGGPGGPGGPVGPPPGR